MFRIVVQHAAGTSQKLAGIADLLGASDVKSSRTFTVLKADHNPSADLLERARSFAQTDINVLPPAFDPASVRLVISDMDSTLINIECIDEIADFAGVKPQVSVITEAAMRGELDFAQSLTKRVSLLDGLSTDVLGKVYDERLRLNPGAETMLRGLRQHKIKFALVSGGFTFFTERLQKRLDLDFIRANVLDVQNNRLTGKIQGAIVGAEAKRDFLLELCRQLKIEPTQTVAMGDGANDLKMLAAAGLGIAYHAKPKVREQAPCSIQFGGLEAVLGLLGIEA